MDKDAVELREARLDDRLPPAFVRHLDDAPAEALNRRQLRLGRPLWNDDGAGDSELARGPCDALAHVARARRDHARLELGGGELRDRVQRPAQLDRADWLQVLELPVDRRGRGQCKPDKRWADGPRADA